LKPPDNNQKLPQIKVDVVKNKTIFGNSPLKGNID
jgi:hypothetical protein